MMPQGHRAAAMAARASVRLSPAGETPLDGCSAMLYGPATEPARHHNARDRIDDSSNLQSGATLTDC
jgi:hypothetical protein